MNDISIAALRTFRAVARCGSFTAAARDLGCTQSAISRNMATLESHIQQTLVLRGHRRIQLTPAGELYLEAVIRALEELDHGARRVASAAGARPGVKILAMPSFAARWLMPRLVKLQQARLDVDVEIATSFWDADFQKERFDLAIHYGDGAWPGARLLMQDSLVPVTAPQSGSSGNCAQIADLARFPWLHDSLRSGKWAQWLASAGAGELSSARNMKLPDTEATLTAAVAGLGIAIGHVALVDNDIRAGRLLEAWPHHAPLAAGYHLIQSKRVARNPAARALADWLMGEASAYNGVQ